MNNLLLVNDLSGVGKVAIAVALPILSVAQIETSLLPTTLLSTHTGNFPNNFVKPLSDEMLAILQHWQTLDLTFTAILTGYFGKAEHIHTFLNNLPKHQRLIVDPVMADNGVLYRGFALDYPDTMRLLCQQADTIMPNITEACLLLQRPMLSAHYTLDDVQSLLVALSQLGPQTVIITGVSFDDEHIGAAYLSNGNFGYCCNKKIDGHFFGTGDVFSALVSALLLHQVPIQEAIDYTLQFIVNALSDTLHIQRDRKFGIRFEKQLVSLATYIQSKGETIS